MQLTHNYKTASLVQQKKWPHLDVRKQTRPNQSCRAANNSWSSNKVQLKLAHVRRNLNCLWTSVGHVLSNLITKRQSLALQGPGVRRPIRANSRLNFYLDFFFFFNKAFSQKHFFYSFLSMQSSVCRQKEFN